MSRNNPNRIHNALLELAKENSGLVATLALGLVPAAAEQEADLDSPAYKDIRERISITVEQLAAEGRGPEKVIAALLEIDNALCSCGAVDVPWAARLAVLVSERALHAFERRWREDLTKDLAERSPILKFDSRTLIATPVGPMEADGLARISDRILAEVMLTRPKRVVLVLHGLDPSQASAAVWDALALDLESQKVRFERKLVLI